MDPAGRVIAVTGGASGIGRALAEVASVRGAAGVAIADLDGSGAQATAESLECPALAIECDVTDADAVGGLISTATEALGPIDVFCANAGIVTGAGLEADARQWDRALAVNTRTHVNAAQVLVPQWLERGGYFLATVSAAGVLTQIGDAPYAVSKHAALAFAEWLRVTYGDRGIGVSCLCPMGVDTPLLREGFSGDDADEQAARVVEDAGAILSAEEVAEAAWDGVRDERFLILPHAEVATFFQRKSLDYERWIGGMQRLRRRTESGAGEP